MFQGLRSHLLAAPDLARAKDWYARALGQAPYFDEPFYVGFNVGGFELGLVPDARPATGPGGGVAYWGVDDVAATHARLLALGATALEAPTEVGGGIVVASVVDPFGNTVGLIFNPHFVPAGAR
ncbi:VOC family protein [Oleiharenicola sp. Vm1]|uniref:VOC family protein n=1 Tax=Oleiharenicola sp. Vm1 TaxID=3398393 RepID=UPI0039F4EAC0